MSCTTRGNTKDRAEWLFHVYDIDGDGQITVGEFQEALKYRLKQSQLRDLREIFSEIDDDKNGMLERSEFIKAVEASGRLREYFDCY